MPRQLRIAAVLTSLLILADTAALAQSAENRPLQLEAKILLGDVRGRIDHMAIDLKRQRLFVAELGNDSLGVVDLASRSLIRTITGLNEPQGVGYEPSTDTLYVANARDGSVKLFDGNAYKATGTIDLGSDADNVRVDAVAGRVVIGYGEGGLAMVDPSSRNRTQNVALKAHPESFQIDANTGRIFVNLPDAHAVAIVDERSGNAIASWPMDKSGNFAMALDHDRGRVLVAFRNPPELAIFSMADGKSLWKAETCGDVDDIFVDPKRARAYVSCGAGFIDVFEAAGTDYRHLARVPTSAGARTSFYVPELDRLLVAVRAGLARPAAIWVFKPTP
ncbi:DNA-binding beta-propeller fold protein YncE [Bradyrhizobium sp. i1.8.4]|uniref:YncE family protein n=1 Tax=unclassified Bradyrhizobium TaxID=2631580 RepID=UPI003D218E43